ncbi:MAG: helix-turn-helix domain-containing protein, partial [Bacteroidota bacterium]
FFSYLALSYRYLKFKEVASKKKGYIWERHKIRWHKQMVRVLFLLAGLNTFYVVTDFVAYNWLGVNMYNVQGYSALGDLSFAAMLAWLCFHAWSLAMRAPYVRRYRRPIKQWTDLFWAEWKEQKWYLDPDIRPIHLCKRYGIKPDDFKLILEKQQANFQQLVEAYRLREVKHLLGHRRYRRFTWSSIGFLAGYFSANKFQQLFREATGMSPLEYQQNAQATSIST